MQAAELSGEGLFYDWQQGWKGISKRTHVASGYETLLVACRTRLWWQNCQWWTLPVCYADQCGWPYGRLPKLAARQSSRRSAGSFRRGFNPWGASLRAACGPVQAATALDIPACHGALALATPRQAPC